MSSSIEPQFDTKFEAEARGNDTPVFPRDSVSRMPFAVRADVVNRTHRVVRQRARLMQARRSRLRGLAAPLIICSAFLILTGFAVWSGLYQYQAADAMSEVQADVAAIATNDANDQYLVVLLWFVPVSLAVLGTVWFRRTRNGGHETVQ